jgi:hypothetical protein
MVAVGLIGVAIGTAAVAWRSMRWAISGRLELGLLTMGGAAIPAFSLGLLLAGPIGALTVPTGATLLGFAVALASGGDGGDPEPAPEPPWWPSFERDLRRYERKRVPARRP